MLSGLGPAAFQARRKRSSENGWFRVHTPIGVILGFYWGCIGIMENNGNYYSITGYILGLYWGYIGIMENKM